MEERLPTFMSERDDKESALNEMLNPTYAESHIANLTQMKRSPNARVASIK